MWLLIGLGIFFGVIGVLIALVILFPARSVRPAPVPPRIDSFDVHPRHVCRNDNVTATWRSDGDAGTLNATIPGGSRPFFSQSLDSSNLTEGSLTFRADTVGSFTVDLMLARGSGTDRTTTTRSVNIIGHDSPNDVIRLSVQPTLNFPPGEWDGRHIFRSDPTLDSDDWSSRITVAGLRYREAGGRDIRVVWRGIELATLSAAQPDHINSIEVTVVGEWDLFARATQEDLALDTLLPEIVIDLIPRCVTR
jgi:hypothetical protein